MKEKNWQYVTQQKFRNLMMSIIYSKAKSSLFPCYLTKKNEVIIQIRFNPGGWKSIHNLGERSLWNCHVLRHIFLIILSKKKPLFITCTAFPVQGGDAFFSLPTLLCCANSKCNYIYWNDFTVFLTLNTLPVFPLFIYNSNSIQINTRLLH